MMRQSRPVVRTAEMLGGLILLLNGVPSLLTAFGYVDWSAEQLGAYVTFLNLILAAASRFLGVRVEGQVTPVANPRDNTGTSLVPAYREPPI